MELNQQPTSIKKKLYFEGLNALRGIAALLVLFGHTKEIVFPLGVRYNPFWSFLSNNGSNAVSFFFVLSGFLISYLMLVEIKNSGKVNIRRFYLKRVLRIWPIYYLVIILVQFVIPLITVIIGMEWKVVSGISTFFYLIILPNIPYLFYDTGKLFHLWSIGVEEQFYLIWAPLVNWFKKSFFPLCIFIVVFKLILQVALESFENNNIVVHNTLLLLKQFKIEQMCIGGIGAYFIFSKSRSIANNILFNVPCQLVILITLFFYMCTSFEMLSGTLLGNVYSILFIYLGYFTLPFLYLYLIINVSLNPRSLFRLENIVLNFMGKISYGFYVYHFICILVSAHILKLFGVISGSVTYAVVFYAIAIILNIILSWLSFNYFERKFLKFGEKLNSK